ncbi:MAG: MATE family efflux transporter [Clostridiaceae bacterium]|nr:MATE family efflux transporter [Clostridiaceae bacterium]
MKPVSLTEDNIGISLIRFGIPFLFASLLQSLYGAADMFVVGRFSGSAAVSAVSVGSQILMMITGIVMGLCTGGTVLIARRIGEKNTEGAARAVGTMAVSFAAMGVFLTPLVLLLSSQLVSVMKAPSEAFELTKQYVMICACGIPFIIGYNVTSGIFRGSGDSKTPVIFIMIACIINIAADFLFVGVFEWSAGGAALATVLAQSLSFVLSVVYIKYKGLAFEIGRRHVLIDREALRNIFKVGAPLAFQSGFISLSFLIITAIINELGLVASAAVGVTEKLISFFMLPAGAFSAATATMVAQNIGARKPGRAIKSMSTSIAYSLAISTVFFVFTQFNPQSLAAIFSKDPAVIQAASLYLRSFSIDCLIVCFVFNFNSYFSGCGKSMITMLHNFITTFLVRVPLSYLLKGIKVNTLFYMGLAAPAASAVSVAICLAYFWYLKKNSADYVLEGMS